MHDHFLETPANDTKPFPIETLLARVLDRLRGRFVSIMKPAPARLRGAS